MSKGYAKMLLADYPLFNLTATAEFNQRYDSGCENYSYYLLDQNPLFCWARIEHDWATNLTVLSLQDAITAGMIMPEE